MPSLFHSMFSAAAEGLFYILLLCFVIHAVFMGYHWFTYGEKRGIALIALAAYLLGAAVLFIILSVTLNRF